MHIALISLYDVGAAGVRGLSSFLKSNGHRVSIILYGKMGRTHKEFHQFSKIELSQNIARWCNDQDKQELIQVLQKLNPDLIGISLRSAFVQTAIGLTESLKKTFSVPVVWGGIHPTICPEESIQHADMICLGEGEFPMLDLANALAERKDTTAIPNLWVHQRGEVIKNDLRPLNDLDSLPFPDFTEKDTYYIFSDPFNVGMYPIMTSRGCPFNCTFCCNSILREVYKGKGDYVRRRSVDNVISELLLAKESYQIAEVIFLDDIFVDDPEWLYPFLEEYKKKITLPFACYLHSKFVTEPLIKTLKEAGLYTADLGIQTGSEKIRREVYHRRQSNEEIVRSANILNRELSMSYDIIIDDPFEKKEDLIETINLLLKFPHPFRVHLLTLIFFPKYPVTVRAIKEGLIPRDNADISAKEWLMVYREDRPKEIQSLYLLIAATQHASVPKDFISKTVEDQRLLNQPEKLFSLLDRMIREEDYIHHYRNGEKALEYLKEIKKVLVIPSRETSLTSTVLQTLRGKFPGCLCFLLTGQFSQQYCAIQPYEKVKALTQQEREPVELIVHRQNDHRMKLFGMDYALIRRLREEKFDLAVLAHGNAEGSGYIHVELLALLSGAKQTLIFKPDRSVIRLNPYSFIKATIQRKMGWKR
jgi:anaerobic magnesium-protoporphyrin IX monomethyl ester cyclase